VPKSVKICLHLLKLFRENCMSFFPRHGVYLNGLCFSEYCFWSEFLIKWNFALFCSHQIFILLFTFFIYVSYHLSRKPISVVKVCNTYCVRKLHFKFKSLNQDLELSCRLGLVAKNAFSLNCFITGKMHVILKNKLNYSCYLKWVWWWWVYSFSVLSNYHRQLI